jgi:hypothetical protein
MLCHLKFAFKAPNQIMPDWIALNQTLRNQTKAYIAKSAEVCTFLRYYVALSGNSTLTF